MKSMSCAIFILVLATVYANGCAATTTPFAFSQYCRVNNFNESGARVASVVAGGGTDLYLDLPQCPAAGKNCIVGKISHGSRILTAQTDGDYTCVYNPTVDQYGYTKSTTIHVIDQRLQKISTDMTGVWKLNDNVISITKISGALHARGKAYYPEKEPPRSVFPTGPSTGAFTATAIERGRSAKFDDGACTVVARVIAQEYLSVRDNGQCGDMNVTFSGIYAK